MKMIAIVSSFTFLFAALIAHETGNVIKLGTLSIFLLIAALGCEVEHLKNKLK